MTIRRRAHFSPSLPICLLLLFACCLPGFSQTGPLLTEEATTASAGTMVLEAHVEGVGKEPNFVTGGRRSRWDLPVLRLVYSPADNLEMDFEWTGQVVAVDDPRFGTVSDWGDVLLRAKVCFIEERPNRPGFGLRFGVSLPETHGEQGLGPNAMRMLVQLLLTRTFSRVTVHADAGIALHDRPLLLQTQSDFLAYGLAVETRLRSTFAVMAEINGLAGEGEPGADPHAELRLGVRAGGSRLRWDAALRRGLMRSDGTWGLTAGVTWTLRRVAGRP